MFIPKHLRLKDLLPDSMMVRNVILGEAITPDYSETRTIVEVVFDTPFRDDLIKFNIPFGSVYVILETRL